MRRTVARFRRDDGSISMLVAVMVVAILMMIGLAVDGGGKMRRIQYADNTAAEAARTAGQNIQLPQAIEGGDKVVDVNRAKAAGQDYLNQAGVSGDVEVSPDLKQVTVTVNTTYNPIFLSVFGFGPMPVTGKATAQLVTG